MSDEFMDDYKRDTTHAMAARIKTLEAMHDEAVANAARWKQRFNDTAQKASVPVTQPFTGTKEAMHYLGAIKVRLELLYEHSTQDARLLEHLSDEIDWVDAEIDRLRSGGVAQAEDTPESVAEEVNYFEQHADRFAAAHKGIVGDAQTPCGECHLQDGEVCDICGRSYGLAQASRIEKLEAALHRIDVSSIDHVAVRIAREALK